MNASAGVQIKIWRYVGAEPIPGYSTVPSCHTS
jgi:hypothetical protein